MKDLEKSLKVAVFSRAHGIRGHIFLTSFTDDIYHVLAEKIDIFDKLGKIYNITIVFEKTEHRIVAKVDGVNSRNDAEALHGIELFVHRYDLPKLSEDTFYYTDLIGMKVFNQGGIDLGVVLNVHNFGAGDILEIGIANINDTIFHPFTKKDVPSVDSINKEIHIIYHINQ